MKENTIQNIVLAVVIIGLSSAALIMIFGHNPQQCEALKPWPAVNNNNTWLIDVTEASKNYGWADKVEVRICKHCRKYIAVEASATNKLNQP